MPSSFRKSFNGIGIIPTSSLSSNLMGELEVNISDGSLNYYNGTTRSVIPTLSSSGDITNKTINGNTITTGTGTLTLSTFTLTVTGTSSISGTNTGDQTITLTGDVTGSGTGSFATSLVATSNSTLTTLSNLTSIGTISTGTWNGTAIAINHGGTGQVTANAGFNALSPMTTGGDLIYGGASGVATRLANGGSGQVLLSSGGTSAPTWGSVLTNPMTTLGDIIYENASPAPARLAGNTTTTKEFLTQTGTGSVSAAPAWASIAITDLPAGPINPPGAVIMYAGSSAPTGYLLCDGSAVSRTTFAALFAVISTVYGVGDGSTTFNVPNTKGVFVRGTGSQTISALTYTGTQGTTQNDTTKKNGLVLTDTLGISDTHVHQTALVDGNPANQQWGAGATYQGAVGGSVGVDPNSLTGPSYNGSITITGGVGLSNGDAETRPANITLTYLIKT
jgi:microcystin-dependent protein